MNRMSPEYQRAVSDFVSREVCYCVSHLVSELMRTDLSGTDYDAEELYSVSVQDDWEESAIQAGWSHFTDEYGANCYRDSSDHITDRFADWQELCEAFNIEPYQREAYEHWLVTDWLADRLEEHGEMILRDFMGLTIWGRTTTGQGIAMDRVVCDIWESIQ